MITLEERIQRYLAKCEPAISGSGGSDQTFKVACTLFNGFALDEAETLRWVKHYNQDCQPPWKEKDLRHKVEDAMKARHEKPRGHLLGTKTPQQASGPIPIRLRRAGETDENRTLRTVQSETSSSGRKSLLFFRTLRTLPSDLRGCADMQASAGVPAQGHTRARVVIPSVPSDVEKERVPSLEGTEVAELAERFVPLVPVPCCSIGRPPEIEIRDEDWEALDRSPFATEPLVHLALQMFGPNCEIVVDAEVAK